MHFQLTKYKIFLGKGRCPLSTPARGPSGPGPQDNFLILLASITMCIVIFHTYHCHLIALWDWKELYPTMHIFCPLFNLYILMFGINHFAFDYNTSVNFRLIHGLTVLQKCLKIGPSDCIQVSETSELSPTAEPWTPRSLTLRSLRSNSFFNCSSPPFKKTFRGPCMMNGNQETDGAEKHHSRTS